MRSSFRSLLSSSSLTDLRILLTSALKLSEVEVVGNEKGFSGIAYLFFKLRNKFKGIETWMISENKKLQSVDYFLFLVKNLAVNCESPFLITLIFNRSISIIWTLRNFINKSISNEKIIKIKRAFFELLKFSHNKIYV